MAKKRTNAKRPTNTTANRSQPATAKPAGVRPAPANGTSTGAHANGTVEQPKASTPATRSSPNGSAAASRLAKARTRERRQARVGTPRSSGAESAGARSGRTPEARTRNATQRAQAQRRAAASSFWRRNWPLLATVVSVILLVAIFITVATRQNDTTGIGDPAPGALVKQVTSVSPTVLSEVGVGSSTKSLQVPKGATVLKDSSGKPIFLYVGAEYCPYCAAERWSIIVALSRFGTFDNLHLMKSGVSDGNLSTFTFKGSSYTSQYVTLQAVETADRNGNALETLTSQQQEIFAKYDAPPYTSQAGGIPFFSIANQYIQTNAGYDASLLNGLTWQQIGDKLSDPNDPVTKAVVGEANYLTAAVCTTASQQPASVCKSATIQQIQSQLPKGS
jgi:hypothetical protein